MNIAIIQARNGSTRFPGKTSVRVEGKTILEHVIERVASAHTLDDIFVATTINSEDLPLVKICAARGVRVFCGSSTDVLDRFYQLAKLIKPAHVVRITADCPLMDYNVIDSTVKIHLRSGADYTSNTVPPTFPDGLDVEVFKLCALEKAWKEAKLLSEREHVTPYIRNNPAVFSHAEYHNRKNLSALRWTLDEKQDLAFIRAVYTELYPNNPVFGMPDVLALLKRKPSLESINSGIIRNAGLLKSVAEDKVVDPGDTGNG